MDIPAYSVALSQANIKENAGLMVMKKAMDRNQELAAGVIRMAAGATPALPYLGANIDIKV